MRHVLVVDNYDSFTFNLVQALACLGAEVTVRRNDEVTVENAFTLGASYLPGQAGRRTPEFRFR